jgi:hypothetical protein
VPDGVIFIHETTAIATSAAIDKGFLKNVFGVIGN